MAEITSPTSPSELPREFYGPLAGEDSIGFQYDRRRRRQEGMKRKKRRPSSFRMNENESSSIVDHVLQSPSKATVEAAEEEQVESKKEKLKEFDITPAASQLMNIVKESLQESVAEISTKFDLHNDESERIKNNVLENITAENIQRLLIEMQQVDEIRRILSERISRIENELNDWEHYENELAQELQECQKELERPVDLKSLDDDVPLEYQQLLSSKPDYENILKELNKKKDELVFTLMESRQEAADLSKKVSIQCNKIEERYQTVVGNTTSKTAGNELVQNILEESTQIQPEY